MTSLDEIQHLVRDAIFETDRDGPALNAVSRYILPTASKTSAERVKIYKSAILGTLERALGNIYPVCQRLVGKQFFDGMARQYAYRTPSTSPDLANYGDGFAQFVGDFEPADSVPYLADVVTLEWHWHRAFHAVDETALDTVTLAEVPESETGRIVFRLPESAALIASDFPIQHIWQVNQPDWKGSQVVGLEEGGCKLIVWRQEYEVRIDVLEASEWRLLNSIASAVPFETLAEQANTPDIDVLLPSCVQRGWITNFELTGTTD
jgi:hypothetical protein